MALYNVFSEPRLIKHYSTVFSRATLFQLIVYAILIAAPFFIVHSTNDLWQYTSTYREQPRVHFLNQWILQISTESSPVAKTWSSYDGLNRILEQGIDTSVDSKVLIPIVKFREEDYNFDRINDQLILQATYNELDYNITAVQGLLFFEIQITSFAIVTFQGMIHFSSSWSLPASRYWITGDTILYQRYPLPASGRLTTYNTSIFNDTSILIDDYQLTNIIYSYHQRNVTLSMANSYSQWESGSGTNFTIQLNLRYPIQTITYTPGFWQLIKFAWIQYLAVLIVFYIVLRWVQSFVFLNQIIYTVRLKEKPH